MIKPRKLLGCYRCSHNKNKTAHTYASYKVYKVGQTIILKCKTCKFELKFKYIDGGMPDVEMDFKPIPKKVSN